METWLMISDITGRQYPHKVTETGVYVGNVLVTETDYYLDEIQNYLETTMTLRVNNRIFATDKLVEISINLIPVGAT